jgi:hypothetical protein
VYDHIRIASYRQLHVGNVGGEYGYWLLEGNECSAAGGFPSSPILSGSAPNSSHLYVTVPPTCLVCCFPVYQFVRLLPLSVMPSVYLSVILSFRLLVYLAFCQSVVCSHLSVTVPPTYLVCCCPAYTSMSVCRTACLFLSCCLLACYCPAYQYVCLPYCLSLSFMLLVSLLLPCLPVCMSAVLPVSFFHAACLPAAALPIVPTYISA